MLQGKKLGVIGVGKLGEALVLGLLKKGALDRSDIVGSVGHDRSLARVSERVGIETVLDNRAVAMDATSFCWR